MATSNTTAQGQPQDQEQTPKVHKGTIGGQPQNQWTYTSTTGFDLTRSTPTHPPQTRLTIPTTTTPITIDPSKSALVIIDMQNFFLSPAFGRTKGPGHDAVHALCDHALPGARKNGMQVVWLNWGLTDDDLASLPPGVSRSFGFGLEGGEACDKHGTVETPDSRKRYRGLGAECGHIEDPVSGASLDAGRLLMRGAWNSELYRPLNWAYETGSKRAVKPDVWVHKDRMSGMWGAETELERFLVKEGIRTMFFAGVNTDQCVGGTLTDSYNKGYDCVLLSDGCGTTSPAFAQQCFEHNAANTWGFMTTCRDLLEAKVE